MSFKPRGGATTAWRSPAGDAAPTGELLRQRLPTGLKSESLIRPRESCPSGACPSFLRPLAGVVPLRELARQEMLNLVITPIPGLECVRQVRTT
jgi:hypothetical protein